MPSLSQGFHTMGTESETREGPRSESAVSMRWVYRTLYQCQISQYPQEEGPRSLDEIVERDIVDVYFVLCLLHDLSLFLSVSLCLSLFLLWFCFSPVVVFLSPLHAGNLIWRDLKAPDMGMQVNTTKVNMISVIIIRFAWYVVTISLISTERSIICFPYSPDVLLSCPLKLHGLCHSTRFFVWNFVGSHFSVDSGLRLSGLTKEA